MRDDRNKWASYEPSSTFRFGETRLTPVDLSQQHIISGPAVLSQIDAPLVCWPDVASEAEYAVVLRRDRVLAVNGPARSEGWEEASCLAVSNANCLYSVFDLRGPDALSLLKRGTEISLATRSKSSVRQIFGIETILYPISACGGFRLHVPRAYAAALMHQLHTLAV